MIGMRSPFKLAIEPAGKNPSQSEKISVIAASGFNVVPSRAALRLYWRIAFEASNHFDIVYITESNLNGARKSGGTLFALISLSYSLFMISMNKARLLRGAERSLE